MPTKNPNTVIVPAAYDHEITILFDSRSGKTELRSKNPLNELVMAALLSENASAILKQMLINAAKQKGVLI